MNKRLQQFLSAENISQSQFADKVGVAKASVSHILAGRNKPGFEFIESVARHFPRLNLEWLICGQGRMYKSFQDPCPPSEDIKPPVEQVETPETTESSPKITKVVIFYDNGTFREFQ